MDPVGYVVTVEYEQARDRQSATPATGMAIARKGPTHAMNIR